MCLAIKAKVAELKEKGKLAVVEFETGQKREYPNLAEAKKGQSVLVQQGLVVEVL